MIYDESYIELWIWNQVKLYEPRSSERHFSNCFEKPELQRGLLYLPTQMGFPIRGERVMGQNSLTPQGKQNSLTPRETTTWTFNSHVIRSCTFETAANSA